MTGKECKICYGRKVMNQTFPISNEEVEKLEGDILKFVVKKETKSKFKKDKFMIIRQVPCSCQKKKKEKKDG